MEKVSLNFEMFATIVLEPTATQKIKHYAKWKIGMTSAPDEAVSIEIVDLEWNWRIKYEEK